MDTQVDWQGQLERAIPHGPQHATAAYVEAGRRAVRRRRVAVGAAGLATAAVVAGLGWAAAPGDPARSTEAPLATDPAGPSDSASPTPSVPEPTVAPLAQSPADVALAPPVMDDEMAGGPAVTARVDGSLVRREGWTVERVTVLVDRDDTRRVWGVATSPDAGGEGEWILLTWRRDRGVGAVWDPPGKRFATFDEFVKVTWAEQQDLEPPSPAQVVEGRLVAAYGVEVLEQVHAPAEAAAYGPVEEQYAARLRLSDGTVLFARVDGGGATTVDPGVLEAPTMGAFLAHLEAQGDSGEGLR